MLQFLLWLFLFVVTGCGIAYVFWAAMFFIFGRTSIAEQEEEWVKNINTHQA